MLQWLIGIWAAIAVAAVVLLVPSVRKWSTWTAPFKLLAKRLEDRRKKKAAAMAERAIAIAIRDPSNAVIDARGPVRFIPGIPRCLQCGGDMAKKIHAESSCAVQLFAVIVFILGVALCFTVIGLPIGIILCLASLFMGYRRSKVWRCTNCAAIIPRG